MNVEELESKRLELVVELKNVERVRAFGRNLTVKKLYKINRIEFTKPNILGLSENKHYREVVLADNWELVIEE